VLDTRAINAAHLNAVVNLRIGWYLLQTLERLPAVDPSGQLGEFVTIPVPPMGQ
jgi:hypothetical protein